MMTVISIGDKNGAVESYILSDYVDCNCNGDNCYMDGDGNDNIMESDANYNEANADNKKCDGCNF